MSELTVRRERGRKKERERKKERVESWRERRERVRESGMQSVGYSTHRERVERGVLSENAVAGQEAGSKKPTKLRGKEKMR